MRKLIGPMLLGIPAFFAHKFVGTEPAALGFTVGFGLWAFSIGYVDGRRDEALVG